QHLRIVRRDDLAVDLDGQDLLAAVRLDGHHAAAGRGLYRALADLLLERLELGLELLGLLDEVPDAFHFTSPASEPLPDCALPRSAERARTSVTSPSKSSSAARTAGWLPPGGSTAATPAVGGAALVNWRSRSSGRTRRAASSTCSR